MFKLISLTVIMLSLSMPLWAGEGDGEEGKSTTTSVTPKAPEGGEEKMVDVPLDEGKGAKKDTKGTKEKKKDGGCTLF